MEVWILEEGEDYEGGRVVEVFKSEDAARNAAFEEISRRTYRAGSWKEGSRNNWHDGGCDWMGVVRYDVKG